MTNQTAHRPRGMFIAFEGGDSAGKSTQALRLAESLEADGHRVVRTREPGGTVIGEKLRSLVLEHGNGHIDPRTEALIFAAARAAHVHQLILPALQRGDVVVCDRYIDSSVAYQGIGRGLGADSVLDINLWAVEGLRPDLTVLLDVDHVEGRGRRAAASSTEDRLESEPDAFHEQIRGAFRERAASDPGQYLVLSASEPLESIAAAVLAAVRERLA